MPSSRNSAGVKIMDPAAWAKEHHRPNGKVPWYNRVPRDEWHYFLNPSIGSRVLARWCREELSKKYPDEQWPLKATRHTIIHLREKAREEGIYDPEEEVA